MAKIQRYFNKSPNDIITQLRKTNKKHVHTETDNENFMGPQHTLATSVAMEFSKISTTGIAWNCLVIKWLGKGGIHTIWIF